MEIVIYIYNGMTMLDAIGPYEVLRNLDAVNIKFVSKKKGEIIADSNFIQINSKYQINEIDSADILLIPGSTASFIKEIQDQKVLNWIKKIDQTTQKTISVCTGSIILAATGLLKGRKATSHWAAIEFLSKFGAVPTRERIVKQDKFITAAGVSAGIDMALYLIKELQGTDAAKVAQLVIEYDPSPPFQSGNYITAEEKTIKLAKKQMKQDVLAELTFFEIIKNVRTLLKF